MTKETTKRHFSFDTSDFSEAVSWVTQAMSNNDKDKIGMGFYEGELKFSYRDRTVFLESLCPSAEIDGEDGSLQLHATALSRFLKVLPKNSAKVTLLENFNADNIVTSLTAKCGNIKATIPCVSGKKTRIPKFFTTATFEANKLFPSLTRAGAATNINKESNSVLSAVDIAITENNKSNDNNSAQITLFGTNSFIMNLSEVKCSLVDNEEFEDNVKNKHFLVPAHFTSLKSLASSAKTNETVELIIGEGKQSAIGFSFPNGSACLFTCINADHIATAGKIFANTKKTVTHKFIVDTKEFRSNFRNVTSLNPESETLSLSVRENNIVLSDEGGGNTVEFPAIVKKENNENDEEFSLHNLKFSNFIISKMFNTLNDNECTVYFSTENKSAVFITYDSDTIIKKPVKKSTSKNADIDEKIDNENSVGNNESDNKTQIIVALYN